MNSYERFISWPDVKTAESELQIAGNRNPGPWTQHSVNVGIAARNIAFKVEGMDPEKAYVLGLLHDIGRRTGIVNIPKHVYEGYVYTADKGWDDVAKICMTHSYPLMAQEFTGTETSHEEQQILKYLQNCQCDDYDLLIQLCDSVATDYGFCILEKRFVDVARRYGFWENTIERWNAVFSIKEHFDEKMGCSIYDVLPDIGRTTLLCRHHGNHQWESQLSKIAASEIIERRDGSNEREAEKQRVRFIVVNYPSACTISGLYFC